MQKLILKNLDRLAGLADLANRPDLDIRPTLLRVLTDLYVQKPSHSEEEERHYVELALRLIAEVDAGTCAAAAASLAGYPAAPGAVVQRLAPFAALGQRKGLLHNPPAASAGQIGSAVAGLDSDLFEPLQQAAATAQQEYSEIQKAMPRDIASAAADGLNANAASMIELRDTFFEADPQARRLIMTNLDVVATPDVPALGSGTNIMRYLEQAALAGRAQEFTTLLQQSLGVSRTLANRIIVDATGEPFAVAARALAMPSDVFQRILMFLNPEIGQSVERVYDLADLFLDLPRDSALHLVSIWRVADQADARAGFYRPVYWAEADASPRGDRASEQKLSTDLQRGTPGTQRRA